eukprot:g5061.t1
MPMSGKMLKKPALMQPSMPDEDAPKMEMYGLGKDPEVTPGSPAGRPYYFNRETEETTWAHPGTGVIMPPSKPPTEAKGIPTPVKWLLRAVFGPMLAIMAFSTLGLAPLLTSS